MDKLNRVSVTLTKVAKAAVATYVLKRTLNLLSQVNPYDLLWDLQPEGLRM